MPKVSDEHRSARRDQIVDAALRSFAAKGFHRSSMADIIAESGLSAGAIYGHFEGKQQLALAVAQRILGNRMSEFGDRIAATGELPAPSAMLRMMMTGLTRDVRDPGVLVQLWGEAVTDPELSRMIGPVFAEVQGVMGPYLERWARERRGLGAEAAAWATEMVPVFLGLGQGYIIQSALLPEFDAEAYFHGVRALLDGAEGEA
jgi:AcrR family transcriptional regulator